MAYFANGSEGAVFDNQCAACPLGELWCPVALVQLTYNYSQVDNPQLRKAMTMLVDDKGICQLKPLIEQKMPKPLTHVVGIDMGTNTGS